MQAMTEKKAGVGFSPFCGNMSHDVPVVESQRRMDYLNCSHIAGEKVEYASWKGADCTRTGYRYCRSNLTLVKKDYGTDAVHTVGRGIRLSKKAPSGESIIHRKSGGGFCSYIIEKTGALCTKHSGCHHF